MPGTVRPSPNEVTRLLQLEREKRRKLRIKQVREQASIAATRIRHAVKDERERQILMLAQQLKVENEEQRETALRALQDAYSESMKTVGSAHRAAVDEDYEGQERERRLARYESQQRAEQRHEMALLQQERERREQLEEDTRHVVARQRALTIEKLRAADIAAMPPPPPDPVLSLQPIKVKPVKLTDHNAFSTTYYHLGAECIAEREGPTSQPSAHVVAAEMEQRMREEEEERKRSLLEQQEKALLRHRTALHGEVLRHDYDRLLHDLSDLQRSDRERRQKVLHTLPKQIFQPPHRLVEEKLGKQRELEKVFEQMYFLETNYAGDISLALDPTQPELTTPVRETDRPHNSHNHSSFGNGRVEFASVRGGEENENGDSHQQGRHIDYDKTPDTALRTLMGRIRNQRERIQNNPDMTSSSFTSEGIGATPAHDSTSSDSSSPSTLPLTSANIHTLPETQDRSYLPHHNNTSDRHNGSRPTGSSSVSRPSESGYELHEHSRGNANNSANVDEDRSSDAVNYDNDDDDALNVTLTPPSSPQLVVTGHRILPPSNSQGAAMTTARSTVDTDEYYAFLERQRRELMQMRFGAASGSVAGPTENRPTTVAGLASGPYFSSRTEQLDLSVDSTTAARQYLDDNADSTSDVKRGSLFSDEEDGDSDESLNNNEQESDFTHQPLPVRFEQSSGLASKRVLSAGAPSNTETSRCILSESVDKQYRPNANRRLFDTADGDENKLETRVNDSSVSEQHRVHADMEDLETRRSQINDLLQRLNKQRSDLEERSRAHEEEMERLQHDWMNELQSVRKAATMSSDCRSADQRLPNSFVASESASVRNAEMPRTQKSVIPQVQAPSLSVSARYPAAPRPDSSMQSENSLSSAVRINIPRSAWDEYTRSKDIDDSVPIDTQSSFTAATSHATEGGHAIDDLHGDAADDSSKRQQLDHDYPDEESVLDGDQSLNMSSFIPSDDGIVIRSGNSSRRDDSDIVKNLPPLPGYSSYGVLHTSAGNERRDPPHSDLSKPTHGVMAASESIAQPPPHASAFNQRLSTVVPVPVVQLAAGSSGTAALPMPPSQTTQAEGKSSNLVPTVPSNYSREAKSPPSQTANVSGAGSYRIPAVTVTVPTSQPTIQLPGVASEQRSSSSNHIAAGKKLDSSVATVRINTAGDTAKVVLTASNKSPPATDSLIKHMPAADDTTAELSTLHSSSWQNELEQYSLSTSSSSKSASSANSSRRSKNVSFDLPQSYDQQLFATAQPLSASTVMPSVHTSGVNQAVGGSDAVRRFSLEDKGHTPPASSFQPLIPDGSSAIPSSLDRWMDYLRRESEKDASLAVDNSGGAQWTMPGEWRPSSATMQQQQHFSDNLTTPPIATSANLMFHSHLSGSSSSSSAEHSVADDAQLEERHEAVAAQAVGDGSSLKSASSSSLNSGTSLSQHTLPDSPLTRSDGDVRLMEPSAVDDVMSAVMRGITDEPELSFVALSSTMSTPQRQPQYTSSPNLPRDRQFTLPRSPSDNIAKVNRVSPSQHSAVRVDMPVVGVEEEGAIHDSNNQSSSLASFEQHEHSLASAANSSGAEAAQTDASGSTKKGIGSSSCTTTSTASWSVVSDSAVMKDKQQQQRDAVNKRPASAGSGKQNLVSIPVAQLAAFTSTAGSGKQDSGAHLSQVISSWKKSRPIGSQGGDIKPAAATAISRRVDPTNITEHGSAERKKAEKDMLARTKKLYNQLEEVKVKNTQLERKKQYAGNREKARDYNQKHREATQRRRSSSRDKKSIPAASLPLSVS